uniref:hypothetical protein n=1 Tax=Microbacterium proteolyticum TaxID=1572644 RepID=UPI002416ACB1|nr:hypothetical protein [Microbacterium proteolyticum]
MTAPRADMTRIREDHGRAQQRHEDAMWHSSGHTNGLGTTAKQYHRASWWAGIEYVLNLQHDIDNMPAGELLAELRKGAGSIYWPLKSGDPTFWTRCPRCNVWGLLDIEGICPTCTYEFQEND